MSRHMLIIFIVLLFIANTFYSQSLPQDNQNFSRGNEENTPKKKEIPFLKFDSTRPRNLKLKEIHFQGLLNTRPEEVDKFLGFKAGDAINEEMINNSIKTLYSLDMFSDAQVDVSGETNGIILNFMVKENYFLRNIKYEGNKTVNRDELDKVIDFTTESYFTKTKLEKSIAAIQKKFVDTGFINVTVSYSLKLVDIKKNRFDLIFNVSEGKKIVVEKIKVIGNKFVRLSEIKGKMKTKEKFFFGIFQSGVLKEEEFAKDKENIIDLYQHNGFMDINIIRFDWKIEELEKDQHKAIVVYIELSEGGKYNTGKITIKGNTLFTTNELVPLITMKQGEVYDKIKMDMIRMSIYNKYGNDGYLYANVSPVILRNANHVIDTELVITEGPRTHIEHISVSGNTKTKTKVIKREFAFNEGELFIYDKLRVSMDRLNQLQYFSDVKPNVLPGSAEGLVNLDMGVEEQRTGLVTFGVGYGTTSGFFANAQIWERNLFGTGRVISLGGQYGQYLQSIVFSYQEPWLFDDPTTAGISVGFSRYVYNNIIADSAGNGTIDGTSLNYIQNPTSNLLTYSSGNTYYQNVVSLGLSLSRRFFTFSTGSIGFATSVYDDYGANFQNPLYFSVQWYTNTDLVNALNRGWTFKNDLSLGVMRDTTDDPLNQTRGSTFKLNAYYFGGIVGGYINFIKPSISYDYYWNPLWKIVLAGHVSSEFLLPQFDGTYNPELADLSYFDGIYEMRGWQNLSTRGEAKGYYSGEFRFQIWGKELWGCFFYDMGNLWGDYRYWAPFNPNGYIFSFGPGIKINIPMLPIRFYVARTGVYDPDSGQFLFTHSQNLFDNIQFVFSIKGLF